MHRAPGLTQRAVCDHAGDRGAGYRFFRQSRSRRTILESETAGGRLHGLSRDVPFGLAGAPQRARSRSEDVFRRSHAADACYRRVLLRDPKLPDELLDEDWPGSSARLLCRNLCRLVQATAEQHLMAELETADGAVPPAQPSYFKRFGGLEAVVATN